MSVKVGEGMEGCLRMEKMSCKKSYFILSINLLNESFTFVIIFKDVWPYSKFSMRPIISLLSVIIKWHVFILFKFLLKLIFCGRRHIRSFHSSFSLLSSPSQNKDKSSTSCPSPSSPIGGS